METQDRINLGQAKNQAATLLKEVYFKADKADRKIIYKELVMQFYDWNKEIDLELERVGVVSDKKPFNHIVSPNVNKPTSKTPSDKQKVCPRCNTIIPKSWSKHIECGWKE